MPRSASAAGSSPAPTRIAAPATAQTASGRRQGRTMTPPVASAAIPQVAAMALTGKASRSGQSRSAWFDHSGEKARQGCGSGTARRWRWRMAEETRRGRRGGDLGELRRVRPDGTRRDDAPERAFEPVAPDIKRRARGEPGRQGLRFRRRHAYDRAVLDQDAVQFALRPMQLGLDPALGGQLLLVSAR